MHNFHEFECPASVYLNPLFNINNTCTSVSGYLQNGTEQAANFFEGINSDYITQLRSLKCLSSKLGLKNILVKDESSFLDLGSFKGRGAMWAMAKICAKHYGLKDNAPDVSLIRKSSAADKKSLFSLLLQMEIMGQQLPVLPKSWGKKPLFLCQLAQARHELTR